MILSELIGNYKEFNVFNFKETEITGLTDIADNVKKGFIFGAFKGEKTDGLKYINIALKKGAALILSHTPPPDNVKIPWIFSKNERKDFSLLAKRFFGNVDEKIKIIGVTGTNGKTSITYILEAIFNYLKIKTGVIGSINYRWDGMKIKSKLTTPQAPEIFGIISEMLKKNIEVLIMEVSSHAIATERVTSIDFNNGIFTNLTGDHLDYHKTLDNYFNTKKRLFELIDNNGGVSFVNGDDDYGKKLLKLFPDSTVSYGMKDRAKIKAENYYFDNKGLKGDILTDKGKISLKTNLFGLPNLYNILSSVGVLLNYGIIPKEIEKGFENVLIRIPGRMDRVENPYINVFIDYAHSDDSLKNAILTLKQMNYKRVITVFGAGGNRDKTKRPRMGKVATKLSDLVIITSDNPRTEEPETIIDDIVKGAVKNNFIIISDRRRAIREAVSIAESDDVVLIAGKGHEDYQILGKRIIHFSDFEEVEKSIREIKGKW